MEKVIEGIEYLYLRLTPMDTIKVYNQFSDMYTKKHHHKLMECNDHETYLKKRNETFLRYCKIYYNTEAIIKRELKDW